MAPPRPTRAQGAGKPAHLCHGVRGAVAYDLSFATGMPALRSEDVTAMLERWSSGTAEDRERFFEAVQHELRRIAAAYMRRERRDHTLQPTALVNEAYLRLVDAPRIAWENRAHFYGIASRVMRQILVDHARRRQAGKRKGVRPDRFISEIAAPSAGGGVDALDVIALHDALNELATLGR